MLHSIRSVRQDSAAPIWTFGRMICGYALLRKNIHIFVGIFVNEYLFAGNLLSFPLALAQWIPTTCPGQQAFSENSTLLTSKMFRYHYCSYKIPLCVQFNSNISESG